MQISSFLTSSFLVLLGWTRAATSSFDDTDPLLSWLPESSWDTNLQVPSSAWVASTEHSTSINNASLQFSFQGVQATIIGASKGSFSVRIDDGAPQLFQLNQSADTGSTPIYKVTNLDPAPVHTLLLRSEENGALLVIDEIKIAYPSSMNMTPELVALETSPSDTPSSFLPTTTSPSNSSSSTTSLTSSPDTTIEAGSSTDHISAGAIAGIVVGATVGAGLLIAGIWLICSRRRRMRGDQTTDSQDHFGEGSRSRSDAGMISKSGDTCNSEMREWSRPSTRMSSNRLAETKKFYGVVGTGRATGSSSHQRLDSTSSTLNAYPTYPPPAFTLPNRPYEGSSVSDYAPTITREAQDATISSDWNSSQVSKSLPLTPHPYTQYLPRFFSESVDNHSAEHKLAHDGTETLGTSKKPSRLPIIDVSSSGPRPFHIPTSFSRSTTPSHSPSTSIFDRESISTSKIPPTSTSNIPPIPPSQLRESSNVADDSPITESLPWVKRLKSSLSDTDELREAVKEKKRRNRPSYIIENYYGHDSDEDDYSIAREEL